LRRPASSRGSILSALLVALAACVSPGGAGVASGQEVDRLQSDLESILRSYQPRNSQWGVLVTSIDQRDTLFALAADSAMAPASNLKLLTTAAALRELGPDFRFQTFLLTDGVVRDGVLNGDLVLYGTGDPGISDRFYSEKDGLFHLLVDQLEGAGIHSVTGDLIADGSHLPGPLRPAGWDPRDLNDHFAAAVSALSYNENVVSFRVVANERSGGPPEIHTVPDNAGLDVENNAETVTGTARPRLAILRDDPLDPIRIEGRITRGSRDVWRQMTVPRPAHFAASSFLAVLVERGIRLDGSIEVVDRPEESIVERLTAPRGGQRRRTRVLAKHVSPPLREYLSVINKRSNNLFAELVFRTMGRVHSGQGSSRASSDAVKASLAEVGVSVGELELLDGSGLSAENRVSPGAFVALFDGMSEDPQWPEFWATLPEAGQRRGLPRMYRTAAAGNLRAKTGTIEGVSALSGVVRSKDQERLAFSIVLNGARSTTAAKSVENRIGARLAAFARAPGRAPATIVADALPSSGGPEDDTGRYQVRNGENLTLIARRHGLTIDEVLRANPRLEPNRIYAGQWLTIPQRSGGGSK
jgi:serine-type D-Ala-D-Ala carboxypeptidase/endopeptidase (penicillin-binding protein 4)